MRVKVRVKGVNRNVVTPTLVNTGFEAEEPQLIIPLSLAESLGMTSSEASIEDFSTAGGGRVSGYRVEDRVEVELVLDDRPPVKTFASITILPGEVEAIMSDRLASELEVILLDPWKGYWCLRDELGAKRRSSVPPKEWK